MTNRVSPYAYPSLTWDSWVAEGFLAQELLFSGLALMSKAQRPPASIFESDVSTTKHNLTLGLILYTSAVERLAKMAIVLRDLVNGVEPKKARSLGHDLENLVPKALGVQGEISGKSPVIERDLLVLLSAFAQSGRYEDLDFLSSPCDAMDYGQAFLNWWDIADRQRPDPGAAAALEQVFILKSFFEYLAYNVPEIDAEITLGPCIDQMSFPYDQQNLILVSVCARLAARLAEVINEKTSHLRYTMGVQVPEMTEVITQVAYLEHDPYYRFLLPHEDTQAACEEAMSVMGWERSFDEEE